MPIFPCDSYLLNGLQSIIKKAAIAGRSQELSVAPRSTMATPSSSSKSASMTLIISLFFVGTILPTKSAWMGSSRCSLPRSIEDGELHATRAAEVDQLIERRADRAPGVKHVVDEHDVAILDVAGQLCPIDDRISADGRKIVAISVISSDADGRALAFEVCDLIGHALRQRHAAPPDSDQIKIARAVVLFDDLRGKPRARD